MTSIPLFLSQEHPCSYLENLDAQAIFVHPSFQLSSSIYSRLIEQGFRRSGDQVYRPHCPECDACCPVRIPVNTFNPSRNQRRCEQKNLPTQASIKPAVFNQQHYEMYLRYQRQRHRFSNMADSSPEDYMNFLTCEWSDTLFVEFSIEQRLAAVAIIDRLDNALSAVYTFFEPEFSAFSPGVFSVLWQIKQAQRWKLDYVYLGFWIEACRKMSYKTQYRPIQGYLNGKWKPMEK